MDHETPLNIIQHIEADLSRRFTRVLRLALSTIIIPALAFLFTLSVANTIEAFIIATDNTTWQTLINASFFTGAFGVAYLALLRAEAHFHGLAFIARFTRLWSAVREMHRGLAGGAFSSDNTEIAALQDQHNTFVADLTQQLER